MDVGEDPTMGALGCDVLTTSRPDSGTVFVDEAKVLLMGSRLQAVVNDRSSVIFLRSKELRVNQ